MRRLASALLLVVFFVLTLYSIVGIADSSAYGQLDENRSPDAIGSGERLVFTGSVAPSDHPLAVRARDRKDFLTGVSGARPYADAPAFFELETPAGRFTFDWSGARITGAPNASDPAQKGYTGFAPGDRVTVFAIKQGDGTLSAKYISGFTPADLARDRFRSGVRVLIAGLLFLGGSFLLPVLFRRYERRSISWAATSVRRVFTERGDAGGDRCPECGKSEILGLDACAACGRTIQPAPQVLDIERALERIRDFHAGSLVVRAAGGASLRLRWADSITMEFRPGELTARNTDRLRQVLTRLGIDPHREPGAIWQIQLGASPRAAAKIAHTVFVDVFGTDIGYRVQVDLHT